MTEVNESVLSEMVEALVREVAPERVILFGSRAQGIDEAGSDIDLLIEERDPFGPARSRRQELSRIRRALSRFRVAKDLLVFSSEEVARWRNSINHVIARALEEGKVLYERS